MSIILLNSPTLRGLDELEWLALKSWLMGVAAHRALDYIQDDDRPEDVEPHHYLAILKSRAIAIARAHERHELVSLLRDPQPVGEASIKRIRDALNTLQNLPLQILPKAGDALAKWLPARVANPLIRHGWHTITDLHLASVDATWFQHVPGLGRAGRSASEALLHTLHEAHQLSVIKRPVNRLRQAWLALSSDAAPAQIDGRQGRFRGPRDACSLDADRDHQAIETWLNTQPNELTRQSYRKELVRVLLWATTVQGRGFSDLTVEDAGAYRDFLVDPQPAIDWIGPRQPIESPQWRPFAQGLSESSQRYALQVIRACARWLREQNYLVVNPWAAVSTKMTRAEPVALDRIPTRRHWEFVRGVADRLEQCDWHEPSAQRCRFLLDFLRATGVRVSELIRLRLGDIYQGEPGEWFMRVHGKGSKIGVVDFLPPARHALERYLNERGLPSQIDANDPELPVVSALTDIERAITRKSVWRIVHRFGALAATELAPVNARLATQLTQMSPHTLRHIFGSHSLANGAQLKDVQDGLRHANIQTTSTYVHADGRQRRQRLAKALG